MTYARNDIREQLPEDSERFAKIDKTWREIMAHAKANPNVLHACAVPGLHPQLQDILPIHTSLKVYHLIRSTDASFTGKM